MYHGLIKSLLSLFIVLMFGQLLNGQSNCPCCTSEFRQFDFWLGEWIVYQDGQLAGHNTITLEQDSCVLKEHWRSAQSDYTGTSLNFFDKQSNKWHQTWVDNRGGHLLLSGSLNQDGSMELSSDTIHDPSTGKKRHIIKWTPLENGQLRQQWNLQLIDRDSTRTLFNGLYKPVDKQ